MSCRSRAMGFPEGTASARIFAQRRFVALLFFRKQLGSPRRTPREQSRLQSHPRHYFVKLRQSRERSSKARLPRAFLKSHTNGCVRNKKRALDKHSVAREKRDLFVFAHCGKFVLQRKRFVTQSGGIKKFSHRKPASGNPSTQFFDTRRIFNDVARLKINAFFFKKFLGSLAS